MTLHIVNQSPYAGNALQDCLSAFAEGDALLLIEDGIYAARVEFHPALTATITASNLYCLSADATARGVAVSEGITSIDEARWVALCIEHNPIVSWFK